MIGVLLATLGTFFTEIATTIGKRKVEEGKESVYTLAFLNMFAATLCFFAIALLWPQTFTFSLASLQSFIPRLILEIAQMHFTIIAIREADRSMFNFIRIGTIPLLFFIDIALGYKIGFLAIAGILVLIIALVSTAANTALSKKGALWVTLTAVNAAATISLYKYNIAHFNSIVAEQLIVMAILLVYFFALATILARENPLAFLKRRVFAMQTFTDGAGIMLDSFAYHYGPASVILAAKRSSAVLWSIFSGNMYFGERALGARLTLFVLIVFGLVLLALP